MSSSHVWEFGGFDMGTDLFILVVRMRRLCQVVVWDNFWYAVRILQALCPLDNVLVVSVR